MRNQWHRVGARPRLEDERNVGGIAVIALAAGLLVLLVPAFASFLWPTARPTPDDREIVIAMAPQQSFDAVWADARPTLLSLHPPPLAAEPEPEAAPPARTQPAAATPRRRAPATAAAIPQPPERPQPTPVAEAPRNRQPERMRVLGVDVPTLDDAARLLDGAASIAGSVTRYLPRI